MKKSLKRVVAVLLIAVFAFSCAPVASAEWSNYDNWDIVDISGTYLSSPNQYIPLDMSRVISGATHFVASSSDTSVVKITDSGEAYAVGSGLAIITIDQYDRNNKYLGYERNLAVVPKTQCRGYITKSYSYDTTVNYKSSSVMTEPDVYCDGEVSYWNYYIPVSGDIYVSPGGEIDTSSTGSATVACISVATNGSASVALCDVTVKYSFLQWIIRIFLLGFLWY